MFKITKDQVEQVKKVCKLAPPKSMVEALSGVLISAKDGAATLTCGDMTIEHSVCISCEVKSGIEVIVNAAKFSAAIAACGGADVSLKSDHLLIKSGRKQFKLQTINVDAFPSFPESDIASEVSVDSKSFIDSVKFIQFAAAKNDVRYVLNGVYVGDHTVAINGHRAAILDNESPIPPSIIPGDIVGKIPDIQGKVFLSDDALFVEGESESFKCKLVDGNYPDYAKFFTYDSVHTVSVNRDHLIESVKSALITAPDDSRNVLFKFGEKSSITAVSGRASSSEIGFDCDCSDQFEIGFNGQYILDMLSATSDDMITLEFTKERVIYKSSGLTQIVMMVRI